MELGAEEESKIPEPLDKRKRGEEGKFLRGKMALGDVATRLKTPPKPIKADLQKWKSVAGGYKEEIKAGSCLKNPPQPRRKRNGAVW